MIRIGCPHWWCVPARYIYLCFALLVFAAFCAVYTTAQASQLFAALADARVGSVPARNRPLPLPLASV